MKEERQEWDSERIIGRVKDRFKELEAKQWNWRSFYNGWLEGRSDMLQQIKGIGNYKPKEGNKDHEVDGGAFSKWIIDNGFTRTQSHDGKEWLWHDYTGRYGQCNYTPAELWNEWNN